MKQPKHKKELITKRDIALAALNLAFGFFGALAAALLVMVLEHSLY
ncbi:MAG: hypothetical protein RSG23_10575 [Gordonibacter sp.]